VIRGDPRALAIGCGVLAELGRLMLAVDIRNWLRPEAATSPSAILPRLRAGQGAGADDPGLAVLGDRGTGAGSHLLDRGAGRGGLGRDDEAEVTAIQTREVITWSIAAMHCQAIQPLWHDAGLTAVLAAGTATCGTRTCHHDFSA
jgi:hypothetical protein